MNCHSLALAFVERFARGDVDGLGKLLADEFHLRGPLGEYFSRVDYLDALRGDLDPATEFTIVSESLDGVEVRIDYVYRDKLISQRFRCQAGRIVDSRVEFDAAGPGE